MRPMEIMRYCLDKLHAYEDHPFGDFPICYKLNGKIFAQLYPLENDYKITLKCTREAGEFYRTVYPGQVVRGYHCPPVQQPYWNTVHLTDFPEEELWNMIDQAYESVLRSFSKKVQRQLEESPMESVRSLDKVRYYHKPEKIHFIFFSGDEAPVFTGVTLHPMFSSPRALEREKEAIQNRIASFLLNG